MKPRALLVACFVLIVYSLLAGPLANAQSARVFFSAPINLSHNLDDTALSYSTHMAVDAYGNVNVVWAEFDCLQVAPFSCTWHLYFTRSIDGAITFSTPKDVANPLPGNALFGPQISVDRAGHIDIVWEGIVDADDIYFVRSTDGGTTFSLPLDISLSNGESSNPQIAVDSRGDINVVWESFDSNAQTSSTFFSRSADGLNFSAPVDLCGAGESCESPEIAIDSNDRINLVWATAACSECTLDVFYSRSKNAGASFSSPVNLSNNPNPLVSAPQITAGPGNSLNVVWSKGNSGATEVYYTHSSNGSSFSTPTTLSVGSSGDSSFPELALGPARFLNASQQQAGRSTLRASRFSQRNLPTQCDAINAAWFNDVAGDIFFSRSVNHGVSFSAPEAVSTPTGSSGTQPYMAVDPEGRISIVWQDAATDNILFTRSNDGGATFSKPRDVSSSPSFSFSPQIALDLLGNLNVAWFDNTTPIEDVFFARGTSLNMLRRQVRALPVSYFKPHKRDQVLDLLDKAKRNLTPTDHTRAVADLTNLLQHVNGCGSTPDSNDWIIQCGPQRKVRSSLNIVINGLSQ